MGEKEVVTKECENGDCCVGEKEESRKEKMFMVRSSHGVAANILMELFVCVHFCFGGLFYVCAGADFLFTHMNAHLPVWFDKR